MTVSDPAKQVGMREIGLLEGAASEMGLGVGLEVGLNVGMEVAAAVGTATGLAVGKAVGLIVVTVASVTALTMYPWLLALKESTI